MQRSTSRILTTHTGSLVRPPQVVTALHDRRIGDPFDAHTEQVLSAAVIDLLVRQQETGIDVCGDGEFGKAGFAAYIRDRLSGFTHVKGARISAFTGRDRARFPEVYAELDALADPAPADETPVLSGGISGADTNLACTAPVTYIGGDLRAQDLARLTTAAQAAGIDEVFYTATAPGTIALQRPNHYYGSDEEYLAAVAEAMAVEYRQVVDAGVILQIDDPRAVTAFDAIDPPPSPEQYRTFLRLRVEALNHALAGIPPERVRYHLCWGSWHGPHPTDIELKHIVEPILSIHAQAYLIEAANARHAHEYHVFEHVKLPDDTILVPGLVSHATNIVEHPELVAERVCLYANLVGRENVIAGTDCGFAQSYAAKRVPEAVQWAKLDALAQGAELASGRLW